MTNGSPTTTESRSPTVTTPATTNANVRAAITRDLLVNPDFNQLLLQRAIGDIYYGKGLFYLRQQMSPEQTTKFEALIAEALTEAWHVQTTAIGSAKDPKNDAETAERLRQTRLRLEEKIRALLGEKGLEAFVRHEREYPVHIFARGLAGELHVTNTPLTPTQAIGLVDVLLQHSSDFQQGKDAAVARIDWDRAFADATRILQPAQIDTLKARAATPRYRHRLAELTKTGKR